MLPFIYTHLVSWSTTIFLLAQAMSTGHLFTPTADVTFGMVSRYSLKATPLPTAHCGCQASVLAHVRLLLQMLPGLSLLVSTFGVMGIVTIAENLADPWGFDNEDLATLHFLEGQGRRSRSRQSRP